jgi:hypothetical protein
MWFTASQFKILSHLQSHGIPAVAFKGPTLAAQAYGNLTFREFGDIDILVHRRDVLAAKEVLLSMGLSPYRQFSARQEKLHIRYESAFEFFGEKGLVVELHWELTPWRPFFPVDPELLWDRLEPVKLVGRTVYTLPPNELLMYLCAHGAKHRWHRLQWVCDVAEFSQARDWPWAEILDQAASLGFQRLMLIALSLAEMLLGSELSPAVQQRLDGDPAARKLARQRCDRILFHGDATDNAHDTNLMVFFCATKERFREKVLYLLGRAWATAGPSDKDIAFVTLPSRLAFLYYAVKPVRVLWERAFRTKATLAVLSARRSDSIGTDRGRHNLGLYVFRKSPTKNR